MLGYREEMRTDLIERQSCADRSAVTHHVQAASLKINNALPIGPLDISIADVPFLRNVPIEDRSACGHFVNA